MAQALQPQSVSNREALSGLFYAPRMRPSEDAQDAIEAFLIEYDGKSHFRPGETLFFVYDSEGGAGRMSDEKVTSFETVGAAQEHLEALIEEYRDYTENVRLMCGGNAARVYRDDYHTGRQELWRGELAGVKREA